MENASVLIMKFRMKMSKRLNDDFHDINDCEKKSNKLYLKL